MTVREHRKSQRMTLHQLSKLSGVAVTQIQAVETGKSNPGNMTGKYFWFAMKKLGKM